MVQDFFYVIFILRVFIAIGWLRELFLDHVYTIIPSHGALCHIIVQLTDLERSNEVVGGSCRLSSGSNKEFRLLCCTSVGGIFRTLFVVITQIGRSFSMQHDLFLLTCVHIDCFGSGHGRGELLVLAIHHRLLVAHHRLLVAHHRLLLRKRMLERFITAETGLLYLLDCDAKRYGEFRL